MLFSKILVNKHCHRKVMLSSIVKPKPKELFWPNTTDTANPMNKSELEANTCSQCEACKTCASKSQLVLFLQILANHKAYQCKTKAIMKLLLTLKIALSKEQFLRIQEK